MKKIGIIGAGVIADAVHIPGIINCPELELEAICDTDAQRLEMMAGKYGIAKEKCFNTGAEMLNNAQLDAVDICTPNHAHYENAMLAIEKGLSYSLEKPITLNTEQAEQLAKASKEKQIANMVCFSYRFKAAARYAKHLVQSGELGEIYHVYMQYLQPWALPVFNTPLLWRFQKSLSGSGALGDLGSHALDFVRFVTGREYKRIVSQNGTFIKQRETQTGKSGTVDVDDFSNYMAEMDNGLPAVFQITRFAYGRGNYQRLEIYGSKGALVYMLDEEPDKDVLLVCSGEAMRRGNNFCRVNIPGEFIYPQMQSFADVLNKKSDGLAADINDGLVNQKALDAILRSAESGKWENINI